MVFFAPCLLLIRIVMLVLALWYGGYNCSVKDCCTVVVFVATCGGA